MQLLYCSVVFGTSSIFYYRQASYWLHSCSWRVNSDSYQGFRFCNAAFFDTGSWELQPGTTGQIPSRSRLHHSDYTLSSNCLKRAQNRSFFDLKVTSDLVDRTALLGTLHWKSTLERFDNLLWALYSHTDGCIKIYGELSSSLETTRGNQHWCPICPFLFDFANDDVMADTLGDLQYIIIELANVEKLCDLDYADDLLCLLKSTEHVQHALGRLTRVAPSAMCIAPSKCKVLLQKWTQVVRVRVVDGESSYPLSLIKDHHYCGDIPLINSVDQLDQKTTW